MSPSHLNHSDFRIAEVVDNIFQEIRRWKKIGIENRDEFTSRELHPIFQRARFEAAAIFAMDMVDVEAHRPILFNTAARDLCSAVSRIIQNLDLQQLAWITNVACGLDQSFDDVELVVYRKLNRNARLHLENILRLSDLVLVFQV